MQTLQAYINTFKMEVVNVSRFLSLTPTLSNTHTHSYSLSISHPSLYFSFSLSLSDYVCMFSCLIVSGLSIYDRRHSQMQMGKIIHVVNYSILFYCSVSQPFLVRSTLPWLLNNLVAPMVTIY